MAKVLKALPPTFRYPLIALLVAFSGFWVFGWQDEICIRNVADGKMFFEFPFFLGGEIIVWVARDFWYTILGISILIGLWGAYQIGARNGLNLFRRKVVTWIKKK